MLQKPIKIDWMLLLSLYKALPLAAAAFETQFEVILHILTQQLSAPILMFA